MRYFLISLLSILVTTSCSVAGPAVKTPVKAKTSPIRNAKTEDKRSSEILTGPKKSNNGSGKNRSIASEDFKQEFLSRINKLRAEGCNCGSEYMPPVAPLIWNDQLELAALGHAQDMNRNKYFDHVSKNGSKLKDRVFAVGYTYEGFKSFFIGENIALGQRSIREVMKGWIGSEGHCRNLMNPNFKEVGIALVNHYWVQDFGARNPFQRKKGWL
ncbi:CAP domain-containing protein [Desertivirga brevis]|uniref:CAP domain-containing protein n=1 Tax=Desertivirga brevis TaxID=2810310 RepID=UPI001A9758B8|nr:CAP domain-containing protein [Pedobacter sp. SYSU D00873]